jgi:hypothetical protein
MTSCSGDARASRPCDVTPPVQESKARRSREAEAPWNASPAEVESRGPEAPRHLRAGLRSGKYGESMCDLNRLGRTEPASRRRSLVSCRGQDPRPCAAGVLRGESPKVGQNRLTNGDLRRMPAAGPEMASVTGCGTLQNMAYNRLP